ncbi:cell division protein FtsB [Snodgrassella alvi]|jgi:cell division protein FtsB|uniref:cell division protein FtsB n=1 Tax=Snodgrassella alvi TaxID=1196083 RepID=UPI000C1E9AB2|nr:cell division protein FtsB [Snodgrassella alvi]PIT08486.1 cell division protein FtsB [Snodgrassella alvi]PIT24628.1 cell division protein FtsB [Snodgrassella alvi]PIT48861.1 cell division protein FtsB [Snodgrassella alvi]PIT56988.1 cell division protein FtsB [Snodgrassella alvi]
MKWVTWVLLFALAGLQYNLWIGHGSWHDMWKLENSVIAQNASNEALIQRNRALTAEIKDLANGKDAINEMARDKLGYIQDGEVFYRFVPSATLATITDNPETVSKK